MEIGKLEVKTAKIEACVLIIKPEAWHDNRKERIREYIDGICREDDLTIVAEKEVLLTRNILETHYYGKGEGHLENSGLKMKKSFEEAGIGNAYDFSDLKEVGKRIIEIQINEYTGKTAFVIAVAGPNAQGIFVGRKGSTDPIKADKDSLRGIFGSRMHLYEVLTKQHPVDNAIHVSDDKDETDKDLRTFLGIGYEGALSIYKDKILLRGRVLSV